METDSTYTLGEEMLLVADQCRWRGLLRCASWLGDTAATLPGDAATAPSSGHPWTEAPSAGTAVCRGVPPPEVPLWLLARSAFSRGEYRRASTQLARCQSPRPRFLRLYSLYLAGEEKRESALQRASSTRLSDARPVSNPFGDELLGQLPQTSCEGDPYLLWLRGVLLRQRSRCEEAADALCAAARLQPALWAVWQELVSIGGSAVARAVASVPTHWAAVLAEAQTAVAQNDWKTALRSYNRLLPVLGPDSAVLLHGVAVVRRRQRHWAEAAARFERLLACHPLRYDLVVDYSQVLFVSMHKQSANLATLCALAHKAYRTAKYRAETCLIIGDYHSAVGNHDRALAYFTRAHQLDPHLCPDSLTLVAQEQVESKNTSAAFLTYRAVLDGPFSRCRTGADHTEQDLKQVGTAHHSLGVLYELLGAYLPARLHFLSAARPHYDADSAAAHWSGVGSVARATKRHSDAFRCYTRMADTAEVMLFHAQGAIDQGDQDAAAEAYESYLRKRDLWPLSATEDQRRNERIDADAEAAVEFLARYWRAEATSLANGPDANSDNVQELYSKLLNDAVEACELLTSTSFNVRRRKGQPPGETELLLADLRRTIGGAVPEVKVGDAAEDFPRPGPDDTPLPAAPTRRRRRVRLFDDSSSDDGRDGPGPARALFPMSPDGSDAAAEVPEMAHRGPIAQWAEAAQEGGRQRPPGTRLDFSELSSEN